MVDGENGVVGVTALSPVALVSDLQLGLVTILRQSMADFIVVLMGPWMKKPDNDWIHHAPVRNHFFWYEINSYLNMIRNLIDKSIFHLFWLVNGNWGEWNSWSSCPVSCGGGEHSRTRQCNNPAPEHGGAHCMDNGSTGYETKSCNENPCSGKMLPLKLQLLHWSLFFFIMINFYIFN